MRTTNFLRSFRETRAGLAAVWRPLCSVLALAATLAGVGCDREAANRERFGGERALARRDQLAELAARVPPRPSFLVLSFDALRADALGLYGYGRDTSPFLDRLAERCIVYERAYSPSNNTPVSFSGLLTGHAPPRAFAEWGIDPGLPTLASRLASAGYDTGALLNNLHLSPDRGFGRGFARYAAASAGKSGPGLMPETWVGRRELTDLPLLERVLEWLDRPPRDPFFFWFHFINPHAPYSVRELAEHLYEPGYAGKYADGSSHGFLEETDPIAISRLRDLYDGEVYWSDELARRVLQSSAFGELSARTVVVVTSDHGESFAEHGVMAHGGTLVEPVMRVPLLVCLPGQELPVRVATPVSGIDIAATLLHLAGAGGTAGVEGVDLLAPHPQRAVTSFALTGDRHRGAALWQGSEKLVVNLLERDRPVSLFDLAADPGEQRDLAASRPERVRALLRELRRSLGERKLESLLADPGARGGGFDHDQREALRALGYLDA